MFRCPSCAKIHKMIVNDNHAILAVNNEGKYLYVKEPFLAGSVAKSLSNILCEMKTEEEHIGQTEYGTPVLFMEDACKCSLCGYEANYEQFYDASVNPIDYFDAEELCHCGTELWMDRIPHTNKYGLICEKCEWVKPNSIVTGNAETTSK